MENGAKEDRCGTIVGSRRLIVSGSLASEFFAGAFFVAPLNNKKNV